MNLNSLFQIVGSVKILVKDLEGNIIDTREGHNIILNTGYDALFGLISGKISVDKYTSSVIKFIQFGTNGTTPKSTDIPVRTDGKLNTFSPPLAVTSYRELPNSITFQAVLPPTRGNFDPSSSTPTENIVYKELVLMMRDGITYSWFSRKTFADLIKLETTLFEVSWTISIYPAL